MNDINGVYQSTKDTVVLSQYFPKDRGFKVRVTGNTLQVESSSGSVRGLAVSPNANIVVVKDEQIYNGSIATSKYNYKEDIEYFTNDSSANGLKRAVRYLNDDENFDGYIAAICEDGRAVSLIIYDKTDTRVDVGDGSTSGELRMTGISYNSTTKAIEVGVEVDSATNVTFDGFTYRVTDDAEILIVRGTDNVGGTLTSDGTTASGTLSIPYDSTINGAVGTYIISFTLTNRGKEVASGKETLRIR